MNNEIKNFKKRLIYRSMYRGTKEMDKLVGSFVKMNINFLDQNELEDLEKFLNIDDDTLYKYYNNQGIKLKLANNKIINLFKEFIYSKK